DIRKELAMADVVMPSLDAVRQDTMHKINRALPSIKADAMVEGLIAFRDEFPGEIDLEIFFCKGLNDDEDEVRLLAEAAAKIRPDAVQLNTVHRPGWHKKAVGLTHDEMEAIAAKMREYGAPHVEVIGAFVPHERRPADEDAERQVLSLVSRRAVDAQDMIRSMAMDPSEARGLLNRLIGEGKIRQIEHEGRATFVGPE
ncbi:hypothetical protein KDL45_05575, partial [bacterium]|nr:hypothetical protein [bacterium]